MSCCAGSLYGVGSAAAAAGAATAGGSGVLAAAGGPWGLAVMGGMMATQAIVSWITARGRRKVAATQIVDEAERHLVANLEAFEGGGLSQQQALQNFDQVWNQVLASCGDPSLGDPGRRCISERQAGGEWDWFARYRTPIASAQVETSVFGSSYVSDGPSGGSLLPLVAAAALVVVGVML